MSRHTRLTLASAAAAATVLSFAIGSVVAQDDPSMAEDDTMAGMEQMEPGISIHDAWTRESMMLDLAGAAYMSIHNGTDEEDRLIGASSPAAGVVEIHETSMDEDGAMAMMPVTEIVLAPNADTVLEPGSFHIMLIGLAEPLIEGSEIELSLEFATAEAQTITLPVVGPMGPGMGDDMEMDMGHGDMQPDEGMGADDMPDVDADDETDEDDG